MQAAHWERKLYACSDTVVITVDMTDVPLRTGGFSSPPDYSHHSLLPFLPLSLSLPLSSLPISRLYGGDSLLARMCSRVWRPVRRQIGALVGAADASLPAAWVLLGLAGTALLPAAWSEGDEELRGTLPSNPVARRQRDRTQRIHCRHRLTVKMDLRSSRVVRFHHSAREFECWALDRSIQDESVVTVTVYVHQRVGLTSP